MTKTLLQTPFEDFAICVTQHKSLKLHTLSTCKPKLSVHRQSGMAAGSTKQLALEPCTVPSPISPSHTHSKGFVGSSSNLAPGGTLSRKQRTLMSLFLTEPSHALP